MGCRSAHQVSGSLASRQSVDLTALDKKVFDYLEEKTCFFKKTSVKYKHKLSFYAILWCKG